MKLSQKALDAIKDSKSLPKTIADVLKVSRVTMWRYLKDNSDELTKASAVSVIMASTGLSYDEVLEAEEVGI